MLGRQGSDLDNPTLERRTKLLKEQIHLLGVSSSLGICHDVNSQTGTNSYTNTRN